MMVSEAIFAPVKYLRYSVTFRRGDSLKIGCQTWRVNQLASYLSLPPFPPLVITKINSWGRCSSAKTLVRFCSTGKISSFATFICVYCCLRFHASFRVLPLKMKLTTCQMSFGVQPVTKYRCLLHLGGGVRQSTLKIFQIQLALLFVDR